MEIQEYQSKLHVQNTISITWRNLSVYELNLRRKVCKQVISNVRGIVQPGQLTGILGGSGSGKSSLMTALAFRSPSTLAVQGDVRINGFLADPITMRKISGYMHQEDIFIGTMSVAEHLWFMARMKLDRSLCEKEMDSRIKAVLFDVGLLEHRSTIIGTSNTKKVLSGGEKKRLAFATELLSDPTVLFLDEPTTGQDSYTARILINQLQLFAARNRTVICTIHQPNSEVFESFKKIILIADGRIAFAGTSSDAVRFFTSLGYAFPHSYNPADFLVGTLVSTENSGVSSARVIQRICDSFLSSDACKEIDLALELELHEAKYETKFRWRPEIQKMKKYQTFIKLSWLIHRGTIQILRDPSIQVLRIVQKVVIALMTGLCFLGAVKLNQFGIQAVQGVIFILVSENTFFPMYSSLSLIPQELPLLLREYHSGMYSVHLYYLARVISLLPGLITEPILFTTIVYWLAGLSNKISDYGRTIFITLLTMNVSTACGIFFSAAFDNVSLAMAYLVPFDYLLMVTMGSFIKLSSIPIYIQWVKYVSWLLHSTEALSIIQWQDVKNISCSATEADFPCSREGIQVLQHYDFSPDNLMLDIYLMIILLILFHISAYVFLLKKCKKINFF